VFTPRDNNRLLDYYKIISISRPILARANMGLDFVSGQYGCLFSRYRKYVINSLIHGHFHIGLVIIPRPILFSRLRLGPIWGCRDDNQANMEMPMYQSVCIAKQYSAKVTCLGERERFQNDFNGTIFR
jgi:hypothetical protein